VSSLDRPGKDLDGKNFKHVAIDCRPDIVFFAVDLDFRLIDGDFLATPAVRFEQILQPMKPLSDRLIRPIDKRFDPSI